MRTTTHSFSLSAKWLHWVVAVFFLTLLWEAFSFKFMSTANRATAIPAHVSVAVLILGLTIARLAVRKVNPPPPTPKGTPNWVHLGAKVGHFLLYALVFYMAAMGLIMAAISPVDIRVFSGFNLSSLADANPALLAKLRDWHFAGSVLFVVVLIGHILGAVWHHFVLRDDVLIRMLPFSAYAQAILKSGKTHPWRFPSTNGVDWGRPASWFIDNNRT